MKIGHVAALIPSFLLFTGLAVAAPDPLGQDAQITATNTTTSPDSGVYVYNVREQGGHNGQLTIGEKEVTFAANHEKHSMSWNYNVLKKMKVDSNRNEITLVFHGGESIRFKVTGGQQPSDVLTHVVAARIVKAPRYNSSI